MPLKRVEKIRSIEKERRLRMLKRKKLNLPNSGSSGMKNLQSLSNKSVRKRDNAVLSLQTILRNKPMIRMFVLKRTL